MKRITTFFSLLVISFSSFSQDIVAPVVAAPEYKEEVDNVMKASKVKNAFELIDKMEPQSNKDLIELTEIPAPPFKEEVRVMRFSEMLEAAGADSIYIDKVGNVIAIRRGTLGGKVVALDAHIDTVFPEETDVTVRANGDTLSAPGIGDNTRGLVVVLAALRAMNQAEIKTESDIWIIGSVGEEGVGDLRGVKYLFREGASKIDSWISVDGGSLGRVTNKGLGSKRYKAIFKGPGGHSWGAFGMANPHHALAESVTDFVDKANEFTSTGARTSYNVGRIGGGTSVNSIPFESWMEVDMRSESPERLEKISKIFISSMQVGVDKQNSIRRLGPELELEIIEIGNRPSGEISNSDPLVQKAIASANYFGVNPQLNRGSTNSNIPISMGISAVTIGRGGVGGNAHALDEWWVNENGSEAIKMALLLTVCEAGLSE